MKAIWTNLWYDANCVLVTTHTLAMVLQNIDSTTSAIAPDAEWKMPQLSLHLSPNLFCIGYEWATGAFDFAKWVCTHRAQRPRGSPDERSWFDQINYQTSFLDPRSEFNLLIWKQAGGRGQTTVFAINFGKFLCDKIQCRETGVSQSPTASFTIS